MLRGHGVHGHTRSGSVANELTSKRPGTFRIPGLCEQSLKGARLGAPFSRIQRSERDQPGRGRWVRMTLRDFTVMSCGSGCGSCEPVSRWERTVKTLYPNSSTPCENGAELSLHRAHNPCRTSPSPETTERAGPVPGLRREVIGFGCLSQGARAVLRRDAADLAEHVEPDQAAAGRSATSWRGRSNRPAASPRAGSTSFARTRHRRPPSSSLHRTRRAGCRAIDQQRAQGAAGAPQNHRGRLIDRSVAPRTRASHVHRLLLPSRPHIAMPVPAARDWPGCGAGSRRGRARAPRCGAVARTQSRPCARPRGPRGVVRGQQRAAGMQPQLGRQQHHVCRGRARQRQRGQRLAARARWIQRRGHGRGTNVCGLHRAQMADALRLLACGVDLRQRGLGIVVIGQFDAQR